MSIQKRVRWTERIDGVLHDEDVDIYTSAKAVLHEDGTTLQDDLETFIAGSQVGDLEQLTTTDKSSLVNAIKEVESVNESHVASVESMGSGYSGFWLENSMTLIYENKSVSTLPISLVYGDAVVLNGELNILNHTSHYKWNGNSWESVSTLPYDCYYGGVVVFDDEIHILGGYGIEPYNQHYKYNGTTWESVSTLPHTFYYSCGAVVLNGEIHTLSGYKGYQTSHYKYNGSSWESVSTLPYDANRGHVVVYNDEIHLLGGFLDVGYTQHYKWNGSSWESVSTLPYNFSESSAVVYNNEIHILGSYYTTGSYVYPNCKSHYAFKDGNWKQIKDIGIPFMRTCAVVYQGGIHIMGSGYKSDAYTSPYTYYHYSLNTPSKISGYCKQNYTIYLPISSTPITDNLTPTDEGYLVTQDGYVEIAVG